MSAPRLGPRAGAPLAAPIAAALALLAAACPAPSGRGPETAAAAGGSRVSDFSLFDLDGGEFRLSDHLGKEVIVMNFWATWCKPCQVEFPHLQKMWERGRSRGLVVIGINMDGPETMSDVRPFARRYGAGFPILLDTETRVTGVHNPKRAAPFTMIIGRDGRVAKAHHGFVPGDEAVLEAEVERLLAR
jgi:peroxiredoxin